MHQKRLSIGLVAALCVAALGCEQNDPAMCGCPANGTFSATLALACPASNADVSVTGPCSVTLTSPHLVTVTPGDASATCEVTVTAADGAASSTTFHVDSTWLPCGSDPHGCGHVISVSPGYAKAGASCETGDAGTTD